MKNLKVYGFCLDDVLIIDKQTNTMFITWCKNITDKDFDGSSKLSKITKTVIDKYLNNYSKFVIAKPILSEYTDNEFYINKGKETFIGEFNNFDEIQLFFKEIESISKPIMDVKHSSNKLSCIINAYIDAKNGLSDWDKNFYDKKIEQEKNDEYKDNTLAKEMIDIFTDYIAKK